MKWYLAESIFVETCRGAVKNIVERYNKIARGWYTVPRWRCRRISARWSSGNWGRN